MESAKQNVETHESERKGPVRTALRNVIQRRAAKRGALAVKHGKKRVRAFGRGAAIGYAIQENPARAVAVGMVIGCVVGAVGLALTQMLGDFRELIDEESGSEGEEERGLAAV